MTSGMIILSSELERNECTHGACFPFFCERANRSVVDTYIPVCEFIAQETKIIVAPVKNNKGHFVAAFTRLDRTTVVNECVCLNEDELRAIGALGLLSETLRDKRVIQELERHDREADDY
ncbi:hypothetical protein CYMTET_3685 [Cymbomonas tetramitiformis]|uniref:Uncharacterized protein n=1 Tax=Cymbomonas tetramitiformis TaxID=36881 RepID=A0AAE0H4L3_9CHLO|nr:hypothetical protein CYMTET_3685 [Cymbomonas tetramitiformis]